MLSLLLLCALGAAAQDGAPIPQPAYSVVEGPAITEALWERLKAPPAAESARLAARFPGLDAGQLRELDLAESEALMAEAARRGLSPLDLFTDEGLRGPRLFFLSRETIAQLFARFELRSVFLASGRARDGKPFALQALVMGGGRVRMLYDRDLRYDNPWFRDYVYAVRSRVTQTIEGPGRVAIEGLSADGGLVTARIRRLVKLSPTEVRVESGWGNRTRALAPIRRLP